MPVICPQGNCDLKITADGSVKTKTLKQSIVCHSCTEEKQCWKVKQKLNRK